MTYQDVYSQFYHIMDDKEFFSLRTDDAYELMRGWLHSAIAVPYIRKIFSTIKLEDDLMRITYELKNSIDTDSDNEFVISVFAQFMKIAWMNPKIDNAVNLAVVLGGKEDKRVLSNYSANIARIDSLENKLKKFVRDYNSTNNSYLRS